MATTQINRQVAVSCALGADALLFRRMHASESLAGLFEYRLDLLSEKADIKIDRVLGTLLTVSVKLPRGGKRYFNGYVTRFALAGRHGRFYAYEATVRPWLWLLTRASNCRIFQDLSVVEILKKVFEQYPVADVDASALEGTYATRRYCVQYRETDFNFVSRLMEHEGIYYYFKSEASRHTMVLADSYGAHEPAPGYKRLPFAPAREDALPDSEVIYAWTASGEIQSGGYTLNAFDFERPSATNLIVKSSRVREHEQSAFERYDYPGAYVERQVGEQHAQARIEALHARYLRVEAASNARGLFPGCLFSLVDHPRHDQNSDYLIVSASYSVAADDYESINRENKAAVLICRFTAIDKQFPYRADCATRKPRVQGPQTAIVVGRAGEELWTDKYGRIKVKFHWDRDNAEDETSSCWVRVAQGWAGKRWGMMFIPRIGQEVIVSFLEGDPDQPLVTGSVYNADTMPPYKLPDHASRSTVKSNSTKGGSGSNELRFEDRKGIEQVFLHAEKDLEQRIKNDSVEWIGNDRHLRVLNNQFEQVDNARHSKVGGDDSMKVGGVSSLDVSEDIQQKAGMKVGMAAGTEIHIKAGTSLVLEAGASITLKAGSAFIVIGPTSVAISGAPVLLNSGGAAGSGSGASPKAPVPPKEADDGST